MPITGCVTNPVQTQRGAHPEVPHISPVLRDVGF
jgi:hypothetical protein